MSSKDKILAKLRSAAAPFEDVATPPHDVRVSPMDATDRDALVARFVAEAEALSCKVHQPSSASDAVAVVMEIVGDDKRVLMWDAEHLPLDGIGDALKAAGVASAELRDRDVRVGLTGADAGLAATGSVVVVSGAGKSRQASMLTPVHIALVKKDVIVPDIETYYEAQAANPEAFRKASNVAVISGPSKSADIAMELILGMHGPGELHLILLD